MTRRRPVRMRNTSLFKYPQSSDEAQHLLQPIRARKREGQSGHLYYWQRVR